MSPTRHVRLNNPALLAWARQSAGYSVDDVARRLQKSVEVVSAWERGDTAPTYRQLQEFADYVRRPTSTLFLPSPPPSPPPPADYRTGVGGGEGVLKPQTRFALRALRLSTTALAEILDDLGKSAVLSLPEFTPDSDPAEAAMQLRASLGVPVEQQTAWRDAGEAFREWREALFPCGVLSRVYSWPLADARAFSLIEVGMGGIGVNAEDARPARVFSLLHEVAHLCLRRPGISGDSPVTDHTTNEGALERYCDAFAAAFLLPHGNPDVEASLAEVAASPDLHAARGCAARFKVSKYVIARRLLDTGVLSAARYRGTTERWRSDDKQQAVQERRQRGGPPALTVAVSRAGRPFVSAVLEAADRGAITTHEASRVLGVRSDQLEAARAMVAPR